MYAWIKGCFFVEELGTLHLHLHILWWHIIICAVLFAVYLRNIIKWESRWTDLDMLSFLKAFLLRCPNFLCSIRWSHNCWSRVTPEECKHLWWKLDVYPHYGESRGRIKLKDYVWFPDYCVDFWHIHVSRRLERITRIWWKIKVKWCHSVMSEGRGDVNYCKRRQVE